MPLNKETETNELSIQKRLYPINIRFFWGGGVGVGLTPL